MQEIDDTFSSEQADIHAAWKQREKLRAQEAAVRAAENKKRREKAQSIAATTSKVTEVVVEEAQISHASRRRKVTSWC